MLKVKSSNVRKNERGSAAIIALAVLVVIAIGAVAFLSGKIGYDDEAATTQTASSEPASGEQAASQGETKAATAAQEAPAEQPKMPEIKPGNPVVAKIGDKEVSRLDVFNFIQTLPPQTRQMPIDQLFPLALDQVVNTQIIGKKVSTAKLDDDPAVKQQLDLAKEQIVRGVFIQKQVEKAMTDERLKEVYDEYVKNFPEVPEVKTAHILVKDEALAKDILKQLNEGGDFAVLAKEHSIDATKDNGGSLGYISRQDQVIPEFLEAAFALKDGGISKEPLKSEFGYHIIKVEDERMRPPASFEQAKPFLASQIQAQVLNELMSSWRADAKVEVFDINGDAIEPAAGE
ncbi:MAG TPA: peptidylprolyl isomerase [Alphaproteobacteria bacterium]|nr:MAG: peptidylprolyl isomerase [Rhodospirillales bacterium]HOO82404.1 peptidylprolyl isomerase [Alphaproteobacteria bacterium]